MKFLNSDECKEVFADKEIYIFGAGEFGEKLYNKISDTVIVSGFIDNNRWGKGNFLCGKEIISLEQFKEKRTNDQPIIVSAYRHMTDISEQLEKEGFIAEKDFYIWDDMCIFHTDEITKKYIKFMTNIWKEKKQEGSHRMILTNFDSIHDHRSVSNAYCSNYLAEKYNASIYGYCRFGIAAYNASEVVLDIYRAFNLVGIVDSSLNEEMKEEAAHILEEVWKNLYTWEDWKNITIYGICFGTTIIRDFLRENVPDCDMRSGRIYEFFKKTTDTIVFWYHYIQEHDIAAVLVGDGVCWDGYIRDIAITKGIPVYAIGEKLERTYLDYHYHSDACLHYKDMWEQLSAEEQRYGLEWAKERLAKRTDGNLEEVDAATAKSFGFAESIREERILDDDEKIKVLICPHIFEEDSYWCGEQIFDNSYIEWLEHLGQLSEKTPNYHWYLKMHPCARRRDWIILENYVKRYPKIKMLPMHISPLQLKKEGADFVLTVCGTIGHEYPAIGIQVINAGINPHSAFDFTWNPRTKEEYDELLLNLDKLEPKGNLEELYQFYSMHYLFYDREYPSYRKTFFENPFLPMSRQELEAFDKETGTWKYEEYMKEWTPEKHQKLIDEMDDIFRKMDEWQPDVFYRKPINIEDKSILE